MAKIEAPLVVVAVLVVVVVLVVVDTVRLDWLGVLERLRDPKRSQEDPKTSEEGPKTS